MKPIVVKEDRMKIGHEDTTTNKHQTTSVVKSATKPVTSESDKI